MTGVSSLPRWREREENTHAYAVIFRHSSMHSAHA